MSSLAIVLSLLAPSAGAAVYQVPTGQPDLQTAVNLAQNGDTIRFTGLVTADFTVTGKSLTFEATSFDYGWIGTMTATGGATVVVSDMHLAGGSTNTDPDLVELGLFCQTTTPSAVVASNATVTLDGVDAECFDSGAVVADDSTVTIRNSEFRYNYYSGAVIHNGGDLVVEDSLFEYNAGAGDGGAVKSSGDLTHIERSTFYANSTTLGGGGGIYVASDVVELESNEFLNNYNLIWFVPGIVINDPSDLYGVSGEVAGLTVGIGEGAGVYVTDPPTGEASVDIHNNTFCGNLADAGAGLYVDDVKAVTVQNNRFAENWSMHYGGGMYIQADDAWNDNERAFVVNNTFLLNTAGKIPPPFLPLVTVIGGGGAVGIEGTIVDFRNNIVANTEFGGGLMGVDGADYTIGDLLTMDYNIFYYNCDEGNCSAADMESWQNFTGDLNQISLPATNIELDPFPTYFGGGEFNCFPDAFYPEWTSPAVRNGDAVNEPNIYSSLFSDIGAYGGPRADVLDRDGDTFENIYDCNDEVGGDDVHPGAPEICDQLDNDCDGEIDEGFDTLWYPDNDGDGYGDIAAVQPNVTCSVPPGYVLNRDDCDDSNPNVNPGAPEICDEFDNNCDFSINGELPFIPLWQDLDGDNYGAGAQTNGCEAQDGNTGYYLQETGVNEPRLVVTGYVPNEDDCNDFRPDISPAALEICDDLDNDCNGFVDDAVDGGQLWYNDGDGDGYGSGDGTYACSPPNQLAVTLGGDCDDVDAAINPGADETCDGIDNDCEGTTDQEAVDAPLLYEDLDNDGLGDPSTARRDCNPGETYTTSIGGDCDDADPAVKECAECGCHSTPTPVTGGLAALLALGLVSRRRRTS